MKILIIFKSMINSTKSNFQAHAFHLVSPSLLPLFTGITSLNLIPPKPHAFVTLPLKSVISNSFLDIYNIQV
uniref:Uncharacterized protein n=1 Tax=Pertusaria plittiana TaxID=394545 RepID=A0A2P1M536_9LECA|nr:hypothetical protein [Pertusaria plittiana]